jgi:TP901 family phage tail tape measure protein
MAATTQHNVVISYKLEGIDGVTRKIRETYKANKELAVRTKESGSAVGGLATRFVGLQAVMSYAMQGGRKLVAWVKDSIGKFRDFEKAMAEVGTILKGDLYQGLELLSAGVEYLSVSWGKATGDLAKGLYDILSAAVPAEDAMGLLTTSTKAAIAGLTDVATSVDVFTSIMNAWGLAASQMHRISDQLFQTVIRGKLVFGDLAHAMGYIAPIAANLGVEFEEVAAALSTVTRQGQHVDMATRGLALGLQNITNLSDKAAKASRKYGVDISSTALRVGGLQYILEELNEATEEYGMSILPEMISNIRSLRVFMALAGREGLAGYTDDLKQLKNVTNETDVALGKMAATSKMQSDILEQSMLQIQRDVGAAWHDVDIWWRQQQLWWGTWVSGGDADKALTNYKNRLSELQMNALKLYSTQAKLSALEPFQDVLMGFTGDWATEGIDFLKQLTGPSGGGAALNLVEGLATQFENLDKAANIGQISSDIGVLKSMLDATNKSVWDMMKEKGGIHANLASILQWPTDIYSKIHEIMGDWSGIIGPGPSVVAGAKKALESSVTIPKHVVKETNDTIDSINERLEKLRGFPGVPEDEAIIPRLTQQTSLKEYQYTLAAITERTEEWGKVLSDLSVDIQGSQSIYDYFKDGIDSMSTAISNHKDNILELKNALIELRYQVEDTYKTLGGASFEGVKRWELAVAGAATTLDRFQHYSQMTIQYGDHWDNTFMSNITQLENYSETVGDAGKALQYWNLDIWEATMANHEFEGNLDKLIIRMGNLKRKYNEATKEIKKMQKATDEHSLAIKRNNLAIMEIELKGMMRRRGLTRSEEKKIKKLQIENMKERIAMTKLELSDSALAQQQFVSESGDAFNELKAIYDEYVARMGHSLWEMKDTRASDIEDLIHWIRQSETQIETYSGWLDTEVEDLGNVWETYIEVISALSESDELRWIYERLFGKEWLENAKNDMQNWQDSLGVTFPFIYNTTQETQGIHTPSTILSDFESGLAFRGRQRGSHYIADTGPYILHRGETVSPSGKAVSEGDVYINIVNNNNITSEFDMDTFASKQGAAIAQKLGNRRTGKSNYRMR